MHTEQPLVDIIDLDDQLLATLGDALHDKWTTTDELLALNVEMTANVARLCVALLNAWSDRKNPVPEPLHIRRPGEQTPTVTMGEMARRMVGKG